MHINAVIVKGLVIGALLAKPSWQWKNGTTEDIINYMTHVRDCAIELIDNWDSETSDARALRYIPAEDFGRFIDSGSAQSRDHLYYIAKEVWDNCYEVNQCATAQCANSQDSYYARFVQDALHAEFIAPDPPPPCMPEDEQPRAGIYPRLECLKDVLDASIHPAGQRVIAAGSDTDTIIGHIQAIRNCVKALENPGPALEFLEDGIFAAKLQVTRDVLNSKLTDDQRKKVVQYTTDVFAYCSTSDKCANDDCTKSPQSVVQMFLKAMEALKTGEVERMQAVETEIGEVKRRPGMPLRFGRRGVK